MLAQHLIATDRAFIDYSAEDPAPIRADIAGSQDLGYTFGRYTLHEGDTIKAQRGSGTGAPP